MWIVPCHTTLRTDGSHACKWTCGTVRGGVLVHGVTNQCQPFNPSVQWLRWRWRHTFMPCLHLQSRIMRQVRSMPNLFTPAIPQPHSGHTILTETTPCGLRRFDMGDRGEQDKTSNDDPGTVSSRCHTRSGCTGLSLAPRPQPTPSSRAPECVTTYRPQCTHPLPCWA